MSVNAWQGSTGQLPIPQETGAARVPDQFDPTLAHQAWSRRPEPMGRGAGVRSGQSLEAQFSAVKAQLRQLLSSQSTAAPVDSTELMSCLLAMDRLHQALMRELARSHELELEAFDNKVVLAQARAELQGTRACERRARHLAMHDPLTDLPNRRFFIERLDHVLAHRQSAQANLAVFFLDLDDFKPVNDLHGHHVGDELLRIVGTRLNRHVRTEDMVSRLGGDEFACLRMGVMDRERLGEAADKLFQLVAAPVQIGPVQLSVRPSIGIALCPGDGDSAVDLLRHADAAMYRAKRQHNRYAFFEAGAD